jgi:hypothetical protein
MAFNEDDLMNEGKEQLNEHKGDLQNEAQKRFGGTNQRDTGDANMGGGGGTNMSDSDEDMSDEARDTMDRNRDDDEGRDYDEVA